MNSTPIIEAEATAAKASAISDPRTQRLLYFLQDRAAQCGLPRLAEAIFDTFPERAGIPFQDWGKVGAAVLGGGVADLNRSPDYAAVREVARRDLPRQIAGICCDPLIEVVANAEQGRRSNPGLPYFHDFIGALFSFEDLATRQALAGALPTTSSRTVLEALDYCLDTRSMVLIEGPAGAGKSHTTKAWAEAHAGQARLVSLTGACSRWDFWRHLAWELGIAADRGHRGRVEQYLWKSGLMLLVDEAQHLWGRGCDERDMALVDWLNTACFNRGVPVAMLATSEFTARKREVESRTGWSSEQLSRRVRRHVRLPDAPSEDELLDFASRTVPAEVAKPAAGYAMVSKRYFTGISDLAGDARLLAAKAGRRQPSLGDFRSAIESRLASDRFLLREAAPTSPPRAPRRRQILTPLRPAETGVNLPEERRGDVGLPGDVGRQVSVPAVSLEPA